MKIVLLTGDRIDGRIALRELQRHGLDVAAVLYEKESKRLAELKTRVKARLMGLPMTYAGAGLRAIACDDINAQAETLQGLRADLIVVCGTKKLDRKVFGASRLGAINLHTGILPYYRGGDSEFWALYRNEPQRVGATVHWMTEELDAGDVIAQAVQEVRAGESYIRIHKRNLFLGAGLIAQAVERIAKNEMSAEAQDKARSRSYRSVSAAGARILLRQGADVDPSAPRVFECGPVTVAEEVACEPSILHTAGQSAPYHRDFCLRIDADEHHPNFGEYLEVFKRYSEAVTIFFCVSSFESRPDLIRECLDAGIDVQSHGYYHYTFRDYRSNLINVRKARTFLESLGIAPCGFAAPTGRYVPGLMQALEDEGYVYASDFSYDYLGLPSYPHLPGRRSGILQIPPFPLASELFYEAGHRDVKSITGYFESAVDEMDRCNLPCVVYGHTSFYEENPSVLESILCYATEAKGLRPVQMTQMHRRWTEDDPGKESRKVLKPADQFLGHPARLSPAGLLKRTLKRWIDYETVTPSSESCGSVLKRPLRRVLSAVKKTSEVGAS